MRSQGGLQAERFFSRFVGVFPISLGVLSSCDSALAEKQIACYSKALELVYIKSGD